MHAPKMLFTNAKKAHWLYLIIITIRSSVTNAKTVTIE